ncbi:MAG: LytTR family DNA-binding domain-containing protein [Mariniphaga sp.]
MDKKINYLIVEDEEKSREVLLQKIRMCNIQDITCIGMATNATEAILLSKLTPPDFVLLDINLPGKNGFDLINELHSQGIVHEVIFTSAHTEQGILLNALKHSPITYLVKPIDIDELEEAIKKVCSRIRTDLSGNEIPNKIKFQGSLGPVYILPETILFIKADAHYSRLFVENGKEIIINQSLSELERGTLLPLSKLFIRPDRSTIVNLSKIVEVHTKKNECVFQNGIETLAVKISEAGIKMVLKAMDKI